MLVKRCVAVAVILLQVVACNKAPPAARAPVQLAYSGVGDLQQGKMLYAEHCLKCHALKRGDNNKGPQLLGVFGSVAGSLTDYNRYSEALLTSSLVWSAENLDAYIAQPKKKLPGTKMHFDGLTSNIARQHIIAYMATLTP